MNSSIIHISQVSIDTPIHVVGDHYTKSIAPIKSVMAFSVGEKYYVPSVRGGVLPVICESIKAGVIKLLHKCEKDFTYYSVNIHAPVMDDQSFIRFYKSLSAKVLTKEERSTLYIAEEQGYLKIRSYTQYSLSPNGRERAISLGL